MHSADTYVSDPDLHCLASTLLKEIKEDEHTTLILGRSLKLITWIVLEEVLVTLSMTM